MGGKKKPTLEEISQPEENQDIGSQESYSKGNKKKKQPIKKAAKPKVEKKKPAPKQSQAKESSAKKSTAKQKSKSKAEDNKQNKKKDYLPGQKYPTPDDQDGALAFYKSLYEKNPRSDMARKWCLEYGVLQPQEAAKLLKEMGKAKK